jgi:hypothetical protein
MLKILTSGYEDAVRSRLGVKAHELPDADINQRTVVDLAESVVISRVPTYDTITDDSDKLWLENAVIAQACALLCTGMTRRLNIEVKTIDVTWKKDKVRWEEVAQQFIAELDFALSQITSVPVNYGQDVTIFGIVTGPGPTFNNQA